MTDKPLDCVGKDGPVGKSDFQPVTDTVSAIKEEIRHDLLVYGVSHVYVDEEGNPRRPSPSEVYIKGGDDEQS